MTVLPVSPGKTAGAVVGDIIKKIEAARQMTIRFNETIPRFCSRRERWYT
jgi:hypothetical protein